MASQPMDSSPSAPAVSQVRRAGHIGLNRLGAGLVARSDLAASRAAAVAPGPHVQPQSRCGGGRVTQ